VIFHQHTLEVHFIEKRKINTVYFNSCIEVFGKTLGDLPGDPVLAERRLNKYPQCYDEEQQRKEEPQ
jgi:hypothetical protein